MGTDPAATLLLVLAAGDSSRMGSPKALLDTGGAIALERILATARRAGVGRARVVLGTDAPAILSQAHIGATEAIINPAPERGRTGSIQEGLRGLGSAEAILLWPVDLPWVQAATISRLLAAALPNTIIIPEAGGRRGHPILIPTTLLPGVMGLSPDAPLNEWVRRQDTALAQTNDPACATPLNTPEEHKAAFARFASGRHPSP